MNRIKEVRKKKGLSLQQVADAVGVGNNTISRYETGKREPKLETWQALANFFDVTVPYLQGIDDKPNTGYSKDYIYKQLDDAYKEKWKDPTGQIMGGGFDKTVDAYLKQAKIKKPSKIDETFWKTNFNFLFDNPNIKRLLTTKDKYNDDDIKLLLEYTIFLNFTTMKQIIDYYNNK
ncbi:XRE family transcriptional regulator [Lactobacillus amylovorus]|uniref:XRE family transcriptional regulator n=1 Tax=Lactobacillus amylovorus TaxID=1604 RepID=A0A5B8EGJ5_LACAM|nr:helix-turn-helix transcriptional regulator [Lactobacillus amylovorus]QDD70660.1 XRE family transcriptional regulator [Lactobacillus amylovorus]